MRPFAWRDGKSRPESAKAEYILHVRMLYCGREIECYCIAEWNGLGWVGDPSFDARTMDMDAVLDVKRWARIPDDADVSGFTKEEVKARRDFAVWRLGTLVGVYQGTDDDVLNKWSGQIKAQSVWGLEEALCHLGAVAETAKLLREDTEPWEMLRQRIEIEIEERRNGHGGV